MKRGMTYRIYTEDLNRESVVQHVSKVFPGATFIAATGLWEGQTEASLIIELCTKGDIESQWKVEQLALGIKIMNNQQTVMLRSFSDHYLMV